MASIKDAFDETLQDEHALAKYITLAIPLFLCTRFLTNVSEIGYFLPTFLFTAILFIGFALKCTTNVRASKNVILPTFITFPSLLWYGIWGVIALTPLIIIAYTLEFFITGFLDKTITDPATLQVFVVITTALCNSIAYTGYLLYARNLRVSDVYNPKVIGTYCADILIAVIFMKIKLFIVDCIILAPVLYMIWLFFGLPHPIAVFYCCMVIVFNIAIMAHYMAQIDYETIREDDENI